MHKVFFISDTHFGHENILGFKDTAGNPLRTFSCVEEMDNHMVEAWNKVVRPVDKVYHLGDVVINKKNLPTLARLNGKKRLVRGNHDIFDTSEYMKYFDEIYGVRVFSKEGFICSHIPIHPESLARWKLNVHGHLHSNRVMKSPHFIDPRYLSVCVEQINYVPLELEVIMEVIKQNA